MLSHAPTCLPVEGGWSWCEGVQVFHLLVLFLVFASIMVLWPPVPRGLPTTLQISAKAFVDTLTHYHHSPLCALPRPYTLQRSARASVNTPTPSNTTLRCPKEREGFCRHPHTLPPLSALRPTTTLHSPKECEVSCCSNETMIRFFP